MKMIFVLVIQLLLGYHVLKLLTRKLLSDRHIESDELYPGLTKLEIFDKTKQYTFGDIVLDTNTNTAYKAVTQNVTKGKLEVTEWSKLENVFKNSTDTRSARSSGYLKGVQDETHYYGTNESFESIKDPETGTIHGQERLNNYLEALGLQTSGMSLDGKEKVQVNLTGGNEEKGMKEGVNVYDLVGMTLNKDMDRSKLMRDGYRESTRFRYFENYERPMTRYSKVEEKPMDFDITNYTETSGRRRNIWNNGLRNQKNKRTRSHIERR